MTTHTIIGKLSGKKITIPDVNVRPKPSLAPPGVIHNGEKAENFGEIDPANGCRTGAPSTDGFARCRG